jgi:hypothetical protein
MGEPVGEPVCSKALSSLTGSTASSKKEKAEQRTRTITRLPSLTMPSSLIIPKRFKFAKGATWLFLGLFILALAYTYYRAEIIFHGEFGEKYFNYYVISLAGILFWGGVLRGSIPFLVETEQSLTPL